MPDQETGRRRRFLVLHDTLPGGTGYLHRLADEAELREVLTSAREVIAACRCAEEGKRACHRCLLSHIDDDKWHLVSRAEALRMLDDLLEDWGTTSVANTREISLWAQVESELEARFWKALQDWAASEPAVTLTPAATSNGRYTADLWAGPAHWRVTLQNTIKGTRPDAEFTRLDEAPMKVAVYLDGYKYHAAPDSNRLADDADKRAELRAAGTVVFQLDWDDVNAMAGDEGKKDVPWPPYQGNAQAQARAAYVKLGGEPGELTATVWCNPVKTLFAFLTEPDAGHWLRRAAAAVAGLLAHPGGELTSLGPDDMTERIVASLLGQPLPTGGNSQVTLVRVTDGSGCPVTVILDQRVKDEETAPLGAWTALAVTDDRRPVIEADEEAHHRRWAAWLYWGNIVQFLSEGLGDGDQIARTNLERFDPRLLAYALKVAGAPGLETYYSIDRRSQIEGSVRATSLPQTDKPAPPRTEVFWPTDLLAPELAPLAHRLHELGVPPPRPEQIGYELGEQAWQAELAWEGPRVAVLAEGPDSEIGDCVAAYAAAGWDARLARDWPPDELAGRILGGNR
jgi:hypothetical protein